MHSLALSLSLSHSLANLSASLLSSSFPFSVSLSLSLVLSLSLFRGCISLCRLPVWGGSEGCDHVKSCVRRVMAGWFSPSPITQSSK